MPMLVPWAAVQLRRELRRELAMAVDRAEAVTAADALRCRLPLPGPAVLVGVATGAFEGEGGAVHGRGEGGRHCRGRRVTPSWSSLRVPTSREANGVSDGIAARHAKPRS